MRIETISDEKLEQIAEVYYPTNRQKDIDGDQRDVNESSRTAFQVGFKIAVNIKLKDDLRMKEDF